MKTLLLFLWIAYSCPAFCQDYKIVKKLTNRCSTIFNGESFGLLYKKEIVQKMEYSQFSTGGGLIVFNKELASVCWNENGEEVLRLNDANMSLTEDNKYLLANKGDGPVALFSMTGKPIVPFGYYEFVFYEDGLLVKDSSKREAFFSESGEEILPFDTKKITVIGDYDDVLTVTENRVTRVYLDHNMLNLPYCFDQFSDYAFALDHEVTIEEYLFFLGNQQETGELLSEDLTRIIPVSDLLPDTNKVEAKLLPLYRYVIPLLLSDDYTEYKTKVRVPNGWPIEFYMSFKLDKKLKELARFPVTGITEEQAQAYCDWLTQISEEYEDADIYECRPVFRLPTSEEWETIASDGMNVDCRRNGVPDSLSEDGCMMFVYKSSAKCKNYSHYLKASKGGGTIPSRSVPIDNEGRYQVFGNVAEMTSENGIAKGGSYDQTAKSANLKKDIQYSSPEPWLGFRVVGEYHY